MLHDRTGSYPFVWLALLVWLPVTAWLVSSSGAREAWVGAAGFAVSMYLLLFLARVFQTSYLIWPLTGIVLAGLLALAERERAQA